MAQNWVKNYKIAEIAGLIIGVYVYQSASSIGNETSQLLGIFIIIITLVAMFKD